MKDWQWAVDIFTFIGILVSVVVALIALVWLTCFVVKLLVKTFGFKVGKSYDLMVEDITKKTESKRERNQIKREAKSAKKMEILNIKLENKQKIHDLKKAKLEGKLEEKENQVKFKLFGDEDVVIKSVPKTDTKVEVKTETKTETQKEEPAKENDEMSGKPLTDPADIDLVDGEINTIEAVRPEEEEKPQKKTKSKTKK